MELDWWSMERVFSLHVPVDQMSESEVNLYEEHGLSHRNVLTRGFLRRKELINQIRWGASEPVHWSANLKNIKVPRKKCHE